MKKIIQIVSLIGLSFGLNACNEVGPSLCTTVSANIEQELLGYKLEAHVGGASVNNLYNYGFCISEVGMPTLSDKVIVGKIDKKEYSYNGENLRFFANVSNLEEDKTYYVRAFIQNQYTTLYSNKVSITSTNSPIIKTVLAQQEDFADIKVLCQKSNLYSYPPLDEQGVCYSTSQEIPTIQTCDVVKCNKEMGSNKFEAIISEDIEPNTTYYIRSYMKEGDFIIYGNTLTYTTKGKPVTEVFSIDMLDESTALVICSVDSKGNEIEEMGIYYSRYRYDDDELKDLRLHDKIVSDTKGYFYKVVMENLEHEYLYDYTYYVYPYVLLPNGERIWGSAISFRTYR